MSLIPGIPDWVLVYSLFGIGLRIYLFILRRRYKAPSEFADDFLHNPRVRSLWNFSKDFFFISTALGILEGLINKTWSPLPVLLVIGGIVSEGADRLFEEVKSISITKEEEDEILANKLLERALELLQNGEIERSFDYFQQAINNFERIKNNESHGLALISLSFAYRNVGEYQKAIDTIEHSIKILKHTTNELLLLTALSGFGVLLLHVGKPLDALPILQSAEKIADKLRNKVLQFTSLINISVALRQSGRIAEAIHTEEQATIIFENDITANATSEELAHIYANAGVLFLNKGYLEKAGLYLEKSIPLLEKIGGWDSVIGSLARLGVLYQSAGRIDVAIEKYQSALQIAQKVGDKSAQIAHKISLGFALVQSEKHQQAMLLFRDALAESQKAGNGVNIALSYVGIGEAQLINGNKESALENLNAALQIAEKLNIAIIYSFVYLNKGFLEIENKQYKDALKYFDLSIDYSIKSGTPVNIFQALTMKAQLLYDHTEWKRQVEALQVLEDMEARFKSLGISEEVANPHIAQIREWREEWTKELQAKDAIGSNESKHPIRPLADGQVSDISFEINHADELLAIAKRFVESENQHELLRALEEYADPAQKIYSRYKSPKNSEALKIVSDLYRRWVKVKNSSS